MKHCHQRACWVLLLAAVFLGVGGTTSYYRLTQTRELTLEEALEKLQEAFKPEDVELLNAAVGRRANSAVDSLLRSFATSAEARSQIERLRGKLCPKSSQQVQIPSTQEKK